MRVSCWASAAFSHRTSGRSCKPKLHIRVADVAQAKAVPAAHPIRPLRPVRAVKLHQIPPPLLYCPHEGEEFHEMNRLFAVLLGSTLLAALTACGANPMTVAKVYDGQLSGVEHDLVPLAEAMPPDKFDFAPTAGEFKGARTFAQQCKHVATVLYIVSAAAQDQKVPVDLGSGENGPDS